MRMTERQCRNGKVEILGCCLGVFCSVNAVVNVLTTTALYSIQTKQWANLYSAFMNSMSI